MPARRACTVMSRSPHGRKSPPVFMLKTATSPFSYGTQAVFLTPACNRVDSRRYPHPLSAPGPVLPCVMKMVRLSEWIPLCHARWKPMKSRELSMISARLSPMRVKPVSIWLNCTPLTVICCISSFPLLLTIVPISTAVAWRIARAWCWKWSMPVLRNGVRTVSGFAFRLLAPSRMSTMVRTKKPMHCI